MEAVSSVLAVTDQCRAMMPVVEDLAPDLAGSVAVATLDVDANPATAARFGVRSIPTFLFFKDGRLVEKAVGIVSRADIGATLAQLV